MTQRVFLKSLSLKGSRIGAGKGSRRKREKGFRVRAL